MCSEIFSNRDDIISRIPRKYRHERTWCIWYKDPLEWMTSADNGCVFCLRLMDNFGEEKSNEVRRAIADGMRIEVKLHVYCKSRNPYPFADSSEESDDSKDSEDSEDNVDNESAGPDFEDSGNNGNGLYNTDGLGAQPSLGMTDMREGDGKKGEEPEGDFKITWDTSSEHLFSDEHRAEHGFNFECLLFNATETGEPTVRMDPKVDKEEFCTVTMLSPLSQFLFPQRIFDATPACCSYSQRQSSAKDKLAITSTKMLSTVNQPDLALSSGSNGALALASAMVENCIKNHPECHPTRSIRSPTRLIEIREDSIRLCVFSPDTPAPAYCTLSHCWGKIDMFKLTNANIDALCYLIPIETLSRTFQDAVKVTRALGFKYLWIDSLCIIQDNDTDWQREAAKMSNVYGDAMVNIAASSASDGSVGLFFERNIIRASRYQVRSNTSKVYEIMDGSVYDRCIGRNQLSGHAWCFQERYLARRTLHFTREQIFYECRNQMFSEAWMEGLPAFMLTRANTKHLFPTSRDTADAWRTAVSLYSSAKLTYPSDKLVAISGVARHLQSSPLDQYVAGLWRAHLEFQLCWRVAVSKFYHPSLPSYSQVRYAPPRDDVELQVPYRAPSWSWASHDYQVTWELELTFYGDFTKDDMHDRQLLLITAESLELAPVKENMFGQLRDASLQIKCKPVFTSDFIIGLFVHDKYNGDNKDDWEWEKRFPNSGGTIWYDFEKKAKNINEPVCFLPVFHKYTSSREHIFGLVVQPGKERGNGYFRRVGMWYLPFYLIESYKTLMEKVLDLDPIGTMGILEDLSETTKIVKLLMDESMYQEILSPDGDQRYP